MFPTHLIKAYDAAKKLIFSLTPNRSSDKLSTAEIAAAGSLSAIPTAMIGGPVERAKVVLQVNQVNPYVVRQMFTPCERCRAREHRALNTRGSSMPLSIFTGKVVSEVYSVVPVQPSFATPPEVLRE